MAKTITIATCYITYIQYKLRHQLFTYSQKPQCKQNQPQKDIQAHGQQKPKARSTNFKDYIGQISLCPLVA